MRKYALLGLALLLSDIALLPTPAEARRTAIDQSGSITLSGYCDFDGSDCDITTVLPYSVDFGGPNGFTNQLQIFGNGYLTFPFSPLVTVPGGRGYSTSSVISPGYNSSTDIDFQGSGNEVYNQSARVAVDAAGNITADWFTCFGNQNCFANSYSVVMRPTVGGFNVSFRYSNPSMSFDSPFYAEYRFGPNAPSGSFNAPVDRDFFIPATFRGLALSAVPEPSVWAMLILGFGFVGASMRRRAERVSTTKGQLASI
ncbi:MAG: PEPxxWA-CTERM sorting domain-containing protein [Sphingomonadaceae bacterium]